MPVEQTNIKVAVRVRPYNRRELEQNQRCIIKVMDSTTLLFDPEEEDDEFFFQGSKQSYRDITKRVNKKISMEFDRVFDTDTNNEQIFRECTAPLIDSVLNGYNCSVFVYGATGAGKTFTMLGSDSAPGITFLTMRDLFEKIDGQKDVRKFNVAVSYLEVYNEQVMNLLTKTGPLKLREDSNGVVVSGLVVRPIQNAEQLLQLLMQGNSNRTQHPTDANAESSRSHAVFQVHIRMTDCKTGSKRTVKLSMIDLAGSERAASTKGIGIRFKEGASINKSLLALGNCINKLADGLKHIPYRDSNLTRILKDSLGGNCQTLMVANVSMSSLTYEDTYNTLKYASRAKKIRTTLRQNVLTSNMPKNFYMKKVVELMAENERLKETNKSTEAKMAVLQQKASTSIATGYDEHELKPWYNKIDAVYAYVIKTQEYAIGMQSKIKNINLRKRLKEQANACNKILSINQSNLQEDISQISSSVLSSDVKHENQQEELTRWRKKLQDANKDLEKLKKETKESKHADILQIYMKSKDLEVQYSIKDINFYHVSSINTAFISNSEKFHRALTVACETLQKSYDSLKTEHKLTPELDQKYSQLQQIMRFTGKDDDYKLDSGDSLDFPEVEVELNGKHVLVDGNGTVIDQQQRLQQEKRQQRYKRLHFDDVSDFANDSMYDSDSDDGPSCSNIVFKKPFLKPTKSETKTFTRVLNETHVLSTDDCNSTFECRSNENELKALGKKNFVSTILSEHMARVPQQNKDKLKSILIKSRNFNKQGLLKAVATGVEKENKKYSPSRIRKSPRAIGTKTFTSSVNLVKRTTPSNKSERPVVRINRAASFRVKK